MTAVSGRRACTCAMTEQQGPPTSMELLEVQLSNVREILDRVLDHVQLYY